MPGEFNNPANESTPTGGPTGSPRGELSGAQMEAGRAALLASGMSADRVNAMLGGASDRAALRVEEPPPPADLSRVSEDYFLRSGGLSAEQVAAGAQALQRAGRSDDEIRRALQQDGYTVSDDMLLPAEQIEHDRNWDVSPHDPSEYGVNYRSALGNAVQSIPREELAKFDTDARGLLAAIGLDPVVGASLMERAIGLRQQLNAMSSEARDAWAADQQRQFVRSAGSEERAKELIDLAAAALKRAPRTEFRDQLVRSGAMADSWVVKTLASHGAKMAGWEAGRPKGR